jgi:glutathione S-transferase
MSAPSDAQRVRAWFYSRPGGMITLYKFIPAWGLSDISPFCSKAETYLRMAGWQYQTQVGNSRKAPKQKLPYIDHDGHQVCDSNEIITYLEAHPKRPLAQPLDAGLSPKDLAASRALQSMLEEHLYYVNMWRRWVDPSGWGHYQPVMAEFVGKLGIPAFMGKTVSGMLRKQIIKVLNAQGTGRHSPQEINAMGVALFTALSDWLGDQPYMLGDQPRTLDASAYAVLTGVLDTPIEGPVKTFVQSRANLVTYVQRMKAQYWA